MERKSNRMVQLTCFLVISFMSLCGTHTLADDHPHQTKNPASELVIEYWWVEANSHLKLQGESLESAGGTSAPSQAQMPYWWENNAIEQRHACRYGWENTVNSPTALMTYWWHRPTVQKVSRP